MSDGEAGLNVPGGWRLLQLKDVCTRITDGTHKTPEYRPKGVRFISIKNIRPFQPINWESYEKYISREAHAGLTKRCNPEFDDILFPRIGTLGFAKRIDFDNEVSLFVGLGLLKPRRDLVRPKFLELWMNTPLIHRLSHQRANGSGRLTLPLEETRLFPVLLPKLEVQDGIIEETEKQFTRLDAGVAALRRVQANLKRYRAAVLKAACEGRLVPTEAELAKAEGRTYETGEQLLARILADRRKNWRGRGKYKEPAAPDITNLPPLPEGWAWATVAQLSTLVQYGSSAKTNEDSTGVPVLRMGNIQEGKLDLAKLKYLPSEHNEFPELLLARGDLLFNRTNSAELVGKAAVFKGSPKPCSFASYLIRVRFGDGYIAELASYFINSVYGRAWINGVVSQQVGQANVNGTKLQALAVPLPPFAEQSRTVAEIERRMSIIEELEVVVSTNRQRSTRLRQSILCRAFQRSQ